MDEIKTLKGVLISEEQINDKAREIGAKITKDYAGESVTLVGILRGAVPWMAELMKRINLDIEIDFMACSSYGDRTSSSGQVKITKDLETSVEGKNVIILEDIIDSGTTLAYLKKYFANRSAKSVRICSLLDKPQGRKTDVKADYVGFEVDDKFVVGFGLDWAQKYRQLPYISYVE